MNLQKTKGFTLIEVLIAAVILFSALAITAELYRVSSFSSEKIANKTKLNQANIIALQAIKVKLRVLAENRAINSHSGNIIINAIVYDWTATRNSFDPRARQLSDSGELRLQFSLFTVDVTPKYLDKEYPAFSFKVATW